MWNSAKALGERVFRQGAKWAYAFNQSRAKVVLDPIYLTVAKRLLGDTPASPKLLQKKVPANLLANYRRISRKVQYQIEDWDFAEAKPELLTERQRRMMHTVALGETSGMAVSDGFLRAFRTNPELAAFFGIWFTEELNHFFGWHLYLQAMGEAWGKSRGEAVAKVEFLPYADNPFEIAAANMYQELVAFLVYRAFAKQAKDPFLSKMLAQFAKDELRHYKFYQAVVVRKIQEDPSFRATVLKVVLKATTPFNQVSDRPRSTIDHLEAGIFYFRKAEFAYFLEQMEFLLGTSLEPFFRFYFRGMLPPCHLCGHEPFECGCEHFEDGAPHRVPKGAWWDEPRKPGEPNFQLDLRAGQELDSAA